MAPQSSPHRWEDCRNKESTASPLRHGSGNAGGFTVNAWVCSLRRGTPDSPVHSRIQRPPPQGQAWHTQHSAAEAGARSAHRVFHLQSTCNSGHRLPDCAQHRDSTRITQNLPPSSRARRFPLLFSPRGRCFRLPRPPRSETNWFGVGVAGWEPAAAPGAAPWSSLLASSEGVVGALVRSVSRSGGPLSESLGRGAAKATGWSRRGSCCGAARVDTNDRITRIGQARRSSQHAPMPDVDKTAQKV